MHDIDNLFKDQIDQLEFSPSDSAWQKVEQKLEQKATARKEKTIRKMRISLSVLVPAFGLFVAYHYYPGLSGKPTEIAKTNDKLVAAKKTNEPLLSTPSSSNEALTTSPANITTANTRAVKKESVATSSDATTEKATATSGLTVTEAVPANISSKPISLVKDNKEVKKQNEAEKMPSITYNVPETKKSTADNNNTLPEKKDEDNTSAASDIQKNKITVPDAFTPNGDGLNDVFLPVTSEDPKEYKLYVYDWSGNLVFFSDNIKNGWDGKINRNGIEMVKEDIYIYKIEVRYSNGESEKRAGRLTLLK